MRRCPQSANIHRVSIQGFQAPEFSVIISKGVTYLGQQVVRFVEIVKKNSDIVLIS